MTVLDKLIAIDDAASPGLYGILGAWSMLARNVAGRARSRRIGSDAASVAEWLRGSGRKRTPKSAEKRGGCGDKVG